MITTEVRAGLDLAIQMASQNAQGTIIDIAKFAKNLVYPMCEG